ncbi:MAG TPA: arylesterase [Gemmatimonadales bacterium]|nr:arylesterase [Gemmatimonadales bacterium]
MPRMIPPFLLVAGVALAHSACGRADGPPPADQPAERAASAPLVLVVGTSLTAGLGLDPSEAYPALLQQKVDSAGLDFQIVNRGVSGETSAGARQRVDWLLRQPVAVLVLETGANDGLRGLSTDSLRANLEAIVQRAKAAHPAPAVLLLGMEAPPNLGPRYTAAFRQAYRDAARDLGVPLVPFLLTDVGGVDSLNQSDGIHPTAAGQRLVANLVWQALLPILQGAGRTEGG